ncbi:hypothetical protein POM88_019440 [Heracleum sosnowskyi]|uniref:Uncharacterized protein n=1 Tax=Heracleum sosnowskyi TaxID=360622 RepID=A0AAD8MMA5_9APIA|nr:hypothetical protein POM88_019440 [Heracleum sosnowskyi]
MKICKNFDKIFKEHPDGIRPGSEKVYQVLKVHAILKDLVHKSIIETVELKLYSSLRVEVSSVAVESLDMILKAESTKATLQLVGIECSYLTVEDVDKSDGEDADV